MANEALGKTAPGTIGEIRMGFLGLRSGAIFLAFGAMLMVAPISHGYADVTYGACVAPSQPELPSVLRSEDEASIWRSEIEMYATTVERYMLCLGDYKAYNESTLTRAELSGLKKEFDATVRDAKRVAEYWNRIVGQHQQRQARIRN